MAKLHMENVPMVVKLRQKVTLSAINTYTEATINTNLDLFDNQILLVHEVKLKLDGVDTPADGDSFSIQLLKQSKDAIVGYDDPDLIATYQQEIIMVTSGLAIMKLADRIPFDPPEIIAQDELVLGFLTAGQSGIRSATVVVRCTVGKVSDAEFIKIAKLGS